VLSQNTERERSDAAVEVRRASGELTFNHNSYQREEVKKVEQAGEGGLRPGMVDPGIRTVYLRDSRQRRIPAILLPNGELVRVEQVSSTDMTHPEEPPARSPDVVKTAGSSEESLVGVAPGRLIIYSGRIGKVARQIRKHGARVTLELMKWGGLLKTVYEYICMA